MDSMKLFDSSLPVLFEHFEGGPSGLNKAAGHISLKQMANNLNKAFRLVYELNPNHRTLNKVDPEILAFATAERCFNDMGLNPEVDRLSFPQFRDWYSKSAAGFYDSVEQYEDRSESPILSGCALPPDFPSERIPPLEYRYFYPYPHKSKEGKDEETRDTAVKALLAATEEKAKPETPAIAATANRVAAPLAAEGSTGEDGSNDRPRAAEPSTTVSTAAGRPPAAPPAVARPMEKHPSERANPVSPKDDYDGNEEDDDEYDGSEEEEDEDYDSEVEDFQARFSPAMLEAMRLRAAGAMPWPGGQYDEYQQSEYGPDLQALASMACSLVDHNGRVIASVDQMSFPPALMEEFLKHQAHVMDPNGEHAPDPRGFPSGTNPYDAPPRAQEYCEDPNCRHCTRLRTLRGRLRQKLYSTKRESGPSPEPAPNTPPDKKKIAEKRNLTDQELDELVAFIEDEKGGKGHDKGSAGRSGGSVDRSGGASSKSKKARARARRRRKKKDKETKPEESSEAQTKPTQEVKSDDVGASTDKPIGKAKSTAPSTKETIPPGPAPSTTPLASPPPAQPASTPSRDTSPVPIQRASAGPSEGAAPQQAAPLPSHSKAPPSRGTVAAAHAPPLPASAPTAASPLPTASAPSKQANKPNTGAIPPIKGSAREIAQQIKNGELDEEQIRAMFDESNFLDDEQDADLDKEIESFRQRLNAPRV